MGNLAHVERLREYQLANPGFKYEFQLINVEDFEGAGETEPRPFFYQVSGARGKVRVLCGADANSNVCIFFGLA